MRRANRGLSNGMGCGGHGEGHGHEGEDEKKTPEGTAHPFKRQQ